jgi:hypothetical protein
MSANGCGFGCSSTLQ